MDLLNISFPVYFLGYKKPTIEDGKSYYLELYSKNDIETEVIKIVDDRSIDGDTLSKRRLQLLGKDATLFKLNIAIFFISDLLKLTRGTTWFIDTTGLIFEYRKTKRVPLIYKKISKIIPIKFGGALIEVENMPFRYKTLFMPKLEEKYAGLLQIDNSYILYGVYTELYPNSSRKI